MNEWIALLLGGGGLISGLIGYLSYRSTHKGSYVDWYDRIAKDNERLREENKELEKELQQTKSKMLQLRLIVNKLRIEIRELQKRIRELKGEN